MAVNSKFSEKIVQKLEKAIRIGSTYEHACNYAGISYQTFRNWILAGEKSKTGKKKEFYDRIKKAEGDATSKWLAYIEEAAQDGNWQAAAWKLERRYPADYGKQIRQQNVNLEVDLNTLSDDQITRLANGESPKDVLGD